MSAAMRDLPEVVAAIARSAVKKEELRIKFLKSLYRLSLLLALIPPAPPKSPSTITAPVVKREAAPLTRASGRGGSPTAASAKPHAPIPQRPAAPLASPVRLPASLEHTNAPPSSSSPSQGVMRKPVVATPSMSQIVTATAPITCAAPTSSSLPSQTGVQMVMMPVMMSTNQYGTFYSMAGQGSDGQGMAMMPAQPQQMMMMMPGYGWPGMSGMPMGAGSPFYGMPQMAFPGSGGGMQGMPMMMMPQCAPAPAAPASAPAPARYSMDVLAPSAGMVPSRPLAPA